MLNVKCVVVLIEKINNLSSLYQYIIRTCDCGPKMTHLFLKIFSTERNVLALNKILRSRNGDFGKI